MESWSANAEAIYREVNEYINGVWESAGPNLPSYVTIDLNIRWRQFKASQRRWRRFKTLLRDPIVSNDDFPCADMLETENGISKTHFVLPRTVSRWSCCIYNSFLSMSWCQKSEKTCFFAGAIRSAPSACICMDLWFQKKAADAWYIAFHTVSMGPLG